MRSIIWCALIWTVVTPVAEAQTSSSEGRRRGVIRGALPAVPSVTVRDDFRDGTLGWEAHFADYAPVNDAGGLMELEAGLRELPIEIQPAGTGYYIAGHNRSDDLFMFLTRQLSSADGIVPNQMYRVAFEIVFASHAGGEQCVGIGGHPGFSVFLKAGASGSQPQVVLDDDGSGLRYRVNFDKGNQSVGGFAASVAGDISTGSDDCWQDAPFVSLVRRHAHPHVVTADSAGALWLIVGTDSGFEGRTRLYYQSITATLTPIR